MGPRIGPTPCRANTTLGQHYSRSEPAKMDRPPEGPAAAGPGPAGASAVFFFKKALKRSSAVGSTMRPDERERPSLLPTLLGANTS